MNRTFLALGALIFAALASTETSWALDKSKLAVPAPAAGAPTRTGSVSAGPATPPSGDNAWNDPSNPNCRQGCTYTKTNERIDLLLETSLAKNQALSDMMLAGQDAEVLEALGDFCEASEGAEDCFKRYSRYSGIALEKTRAAATKNSTHAADLMSKRVEVGTGNVEGEDLPGFSVLAPAGAPQTQLTPSEHTYLPSYDELAAKKKESDKRGIADGSYPEKFRKWAKEYPRAPSPADFAVTRTILRNPSDPKGGTLVVVDRDGQGNPKLDKKAYDAAMKAYRNSIDLLKKDQRMYQDRFARDVPKPSAMPGIGSLSREAFSQVRGSWVRCLNSVTRARAGMGSDVEACGGKSSRAPSAATKNPANDNFTGNEKIEAPAPGGNSVRLGHKDSETDIIRGMQRDVEGMTKPDYVDQIPAVE